MGKDSCFSQLPRNETYELLSVSDFLTDHLTAKYMNTLEKPENDYAGVNTTIV